MASGRIKIRGRGCLIDGIKQNKVKVGGGHHLVGDGDACTRGLNRGCPK